MTVLIKQANGDFTTGSVHFCTIGETVKIDFYDADGNPIQATGVVVEILED